MLPLSSPPLNTRAVLKLSGSEVLKPQPMAYSTPELPTAFRAEVEKLPGLSFSFLTLILTMTYCLPSDGDLFQSEWSKIICVASSITSSTNNENPLLIILSDPNGIGLSLVAPSRTGVGLGVSVGTGVAVGRGVDVGRGVGVGIGVEVGKEVDVGMGVKV